MKTIKIIILVLSVTLAIGGVLFFAKDSVDPPIARKDVNQYKGNLKTYYQSLDQTNKPTEKDRIFDNILNKIDIYVAEDKIKPKEGNRQMKELTRRYSTWLLKRSFNTFAGSEWKDDELSYMQGAISKLFNLTDFSRKYPFSRSTMDSLKLVESIISDYNYAWSLANAVSYSDLAQASSTISEAQSLAEREYLSNCTKLVSSLKAVKSKMAESHYNFVNRQVESLSNYRDYYYDQYYFKNTIVSEVQQYITEYENNAENLYGTAKNVSNLWDKAELYCDRANSYFNDNYYNNYYNGNYYSPW
ncbi:MAG: hypothetical protein IIW46_01650 [Bacteroidaceae bacterium]|nr:hypothetical protein [Bacteroidaceae bacterium]